MDILLNWAIKVTAIIFLLVASISLLAAVSPILFVIGALIAAR